MFALILAAVWPALTSHALLERAGLIHEVHPNHHHPHDHDHDGGSHEHNADDHDFADGGYWAKTSPTKTAKPNFALLYKTSWLDTALTNSPLDDQLADFGPDPPGASPPELLHRWNFVLRTAVNARAPSFLS